MECLYEKNVRTRSRCKEIAIHLQRHLVSRHSPGWPNDGRAPSNIGSEVQRPHLKQIQLKQILISRGRKRQTLVRTHMHRALRHVVILDLYTNEENEIIIAIPRDTLFWTRKHQVLELCALTLVAERLIESINVELAAIAGTWTDCKSRSRGSSNPRRERGNTT